MDDALVDEDMKLLIDNMEQIAATMDGILVEVQNLRSQYMINPQVTVLGGLISV